MVGGAVSDQAAAHERCRGWGYEVCARPAAYRMREYYRDGGWFESELCLRHAKAVLSGWAHETEDVTSRTWCPMSETLP